MLVCLLLLPGPALAAPTSADRETARTLMQQGRELRNKGDLKQALTRFKGADDIMHVPTTALEVARAQVALGLLVEARDAIAAIRQDPSAPGEPAPFKEARERADELDASLNGRIPSLMITVKGAPDGQTLAVSIDGAQLPGGALGLPRTVDPGHHVVTAKSAHAEGKQEVDVREGEQKPVEVELAAAAGPAPAEPPPPPEPAADAPPPTTTSHSPTALTWVGIGLAGAGVIVGTVAGVLSLSKKSALQGECAGGICGPSSYPDYDAASSYATLSTIGYIAAGAGAGVAVVTLLLGHSDANVPASAPPAAAGLVVRPWVGLGAGGVSGRF